MTSDYQIYRGKCKEMSEALVASNPCLKLVRGHYYCPIWNTDEPHWWAVDSEGKIHDPSAKQFPSKGLGIYTEFSGTVTCSECECDIEESQALYDSNYCFCSSRCYGKFVGIY